MRIALVPLPFIGVGVPGADGDTWDDRRLFIVNATYQQLVSYPGVQWRTIAMNSGGNSRARLRLYRKTSTMVGVSRINNDPQNYAGQMQDGVTTARPLTAPHEGFMYAVKVFSVAAGQAYVFPLVVTARMKLYCTLTQRQPNVAVTLTGS